MLDIAHWRSSARMIADADIVFGLLPLPIYTLFTLVTATPMMIRHDATPCCRVALMMPRR